ncbi:MAG: DNA mismatch repair endonuclease MutL [Firmicutes bacterium]|nr:DNA mismatch repair endonuclease MutL [Bacillota bacterium]
MGKIIRLDSKLSNMIAAGEVVERISNVVKELVENSLDALATTVDISLEDSGLKNIKVSDNGTGMDLEDALLSFERHATSKIKTEYDLFHIHSLGFRGEALPSIASISRVELETSLGNDLGYRVIYQDGVLIEKGFASARKGTSIEVTRLFYHTPARFKYLKSPQTELSNIQEIVNKFSLSHPQVSFTLSNNNKMLYQTSGNNHLVDILAKIYGIEVAKNMTEFHAKNRDYEINGYLANPIQNRASKSYITIIVNHRMVKNYKIVNQIIESYDQLISKHRYPIVLLNITVDPMLIDVNIHPSKQEIKFSEEDRLLKLILDTIRSKLQLVEVIQPVYYQESSNDLQTKIDFSSEKNISLKNSSLFDESLKSNSLILEENNNDASKVFVKKSIPDFDYIGQYRGTYLLFQNDEGLFLVDQHAAAERIRYEKYLEKMAHPASEIYNLLVPMKLDLSNNQTIEIINYLPQILEFGIRLEKDESSSFSIFSVPSWFPRGYEVVYTEEVVKTVVNTNKLQIKEIRDELAKLLSCKHSLKANAFISKNEVSHLMNDLRLCHNPFTCPHGRPIVVSISNHEVEKWFKRIMP